AQLPGASHDYVVADLSQPGALDLVASRLGAPHYDVLINNNGGGPYGRFACLPPRDQLRLVRMNTERVSELSAEDIRPARGGDAGVGPGVRTAPRRGYLLGDEGVRGDAERGAVVGVQWEGRLCPRLQPGGHLHPIPRLGRQLRRRLPAPTRAVAGERRARVGGCVATASLAERHHRLCDAPDDSAAASRQPEDGDQHHGEVVAVEVTPSVGSGLKTLVPRLIGMTATAARRKTVDAQPRREGSSTTACRQLL